MFDRGKAHARHEELYYDRLFQSALQNAVLRMERNKPGQSECCS